MMKKCGSRESKLQSCVIMMVLVFIVEFLIQNFVWSNIRLYFFNRHNNRIILNELT